MPRPSIDELPISFVVCPYAECGRQATLPYPESWSRDGVGRDRYRMNCGCPHKRQWTRIVVPGETI